MLPYRIFYISFWDDSYVSRHPVSFQCFITLLSARCLHVCPTAGIRIHPWVVLLCCHQGVFLCPYPLQHRFAPHCHILSASSLPCHLCSIQDCFRVCLPNWLINRITESQMLVTSGPPACEMLLELSPLLEIFCTPQASLFLYHLLWIFEFSKQEIQRFYSGKFATISPFEQLHSSPKRIDLRLYALTNFVEHR